jgi:Ca-activated chloride channel family protein
MVNFETPVLLWGLAALPVALVLYWLYERRRTSKAAAFASAAMMPNVVPRSPRWRRHVPIGLYVLAGAAMLLALARPHAEVTGLQDRGAVSLVIDTSKSMRGTDVSPTRLDAARAAAGSFLARLPQRFDVGLVAFDREARLLSLPTRDRTSVRRALEDLELHVGTAIGDGINKTLEVRGRLGNDPPPLAVVLLSDGNNTTGADPTQAAHAAADAGVTVHTVALGDQGVAAPGEPAAPDLGRLRSLAEVTGGRFLSASSSEGLETIYGELATSIFEVTELREVTNAFAGAAALLLVAGAGSSLAWFNRFP